MPTNPTRSILGCSCARTAGGHAAAAPPSSVMKSRRQIWIAMCPSRGRSYPCNGGTISRFERAVCDYFHARERRRVQGLNKVYSVTVVPLASCGWRRHGYKGATEWLTTCVVRHLAKATFLAHAFLKEPA